MLNPSFGYYFEKFYQEPHGLVYALKPLPEDTLLPPVIDYEFDRRKPGVLEASREQQPGQPLNRPCIRLNLTKHGGVVGWLMKHLHILRRNPIQTPLLAGTYYSRSLNSSASKSSAPANWNRRRPCSPKPAN